MRCPTCFAVQRRRAVEEQASAAATTIDHLGARPSLNATERAQLKAARVSLARSQCTVWTLDHPDVSTSGEYYWRDVYPVLASVTPALIRDRLQVSLSTAERIGSGKVTPHPRHWAALTELGNAKACRARALGREV